MADPFWLGLRDHTDEFFAGAARAVAAGHEVEGAADLLGVDPHDPQDNLHGSARYLLAQLEDFGAADLALAAYNAGPEAVRDYGGIPPYAETEGHVAKVLRLTNATLSSE